MSFYVGLDCLSNEDLKRVRQAVWEARSKWYDLGIELDIHVETLKVYGNNIVFPITQLIALVQCCIQKKLSINTSNQVDNVPCILLYLYR